MKKLYKTIILTLSFLSILLLSLALLNPIQNLAVSFVETLKNDDINDFFWKQQMFAFSCLGIIFIIILNLILFTNIGFKLFNNFINSTKLIIQNITKNKKYLFILFGLYMLGYCSIIRANFWNFAHDDLARQMEGSREWVNFYRYIAEFGSIFIHTSMHIFDIAPLTQFIALALISFASFFIIGIFSDNNYSIKLCIASLPVGLYPFFLSNFSYRYDSPYMALSLCISIIPFLFYKDLNNYIISSILSIFIMCISYQASSGIYIFLSVLIFIKMLFIDNENKKKLINFTLVSIICYVITLLIFSFLFIEQADGGSYVDESMKLSMFSQNLIAYIKSIKHGLGKSCILIFSVIVLLLFIISLIKKSNYNKFLTFFVSIIALAFCIPFTYGCYLVLAKPEFIPRTYIGIGVFIGCISVFTHFLFETYKVRFSKILYIPIFFLSYSCLAFSFGFGNAEYDQKEYIKFRGTILAQDLSECIVQSDKDIEILFVNDIGYAPSVEVISKVYPLIKQSIDIGFSGDRKCQFILESLNLVNLREKPNHNYKNSELPVIKETAYHIIQREDNKYLITFKTPRFNTVKTRTFIEE